MSVFFWLWIATMVVLILALRDLVLVGRAYRFSRAANQWALMGLDAAKELIAYYERQPKTFPGDEWKGDAE